MSFCKKIKIKRKKGFSMLESVIAVAILAIGIVGVMTLLVSSMRQSMDSRDTIIATELAQEGLELVRNVRDNNVASGASSYDLSMTIGDNCRIDKAYAYNSAGNNIVCNYSFANERLYIDANNFYVHGGATATKFYRKIKIEADTNGKKITSTVAWGASFPASCTVANKCTFAQSILTAR